MKPHKPTKPLARTHSGTHRSSAGRKLDTAGDSPILRVDDLDEASAPPIASKAHPRNAMDEMVPTLDDSDRIFPHHPNEPVGERFSFDPESADAAADLAGELGADFVEGATRGRDMSDVILSEEEERLNETPFLVETIGEEGEEANLSTDEFVDIEVPPEEPLEMQHPRRRFGTTR